MSDNVEKLLSTLDKVNDQMKDYQKSTAAEIAASKEGVDALKAELHGVQKQLQEFAELAKKGIPAEQKSVARMTGEAIMNSVKGIHNKAASEGSNADGGYTVNDELATQIRSAQNSYGIVRQLIGDSIVPMKSDVLKVPVDTFEDTATNAPVPATTSENAAITESQDAQLDQVSLTAVKKATLNYVSNELLEDSFVEWLGAYMFPKLARKAAYVEDNYVFNTASTGLLNTGDIQSVILAAGKTDFSDVTFDDLYDMQDEVVDQALGEGKYIMHRSILNILRKKKSAGSGEFMLPLVAGDPPNLCGYPFAKGSIMPARKATAISKGFMLFGDMRLGMVFGERRARQIVTDKSFRFNYDQTAIRMTFRIAMGTNANIGRALCVLKTPAA